MKKYFMEWFTFALRLTGCQGHFVACVLVELYADSVDERCDFGDNCR
jgi:hypothetical protein